MLALFHQYYIPAPDEYIRLLGIFFIFMHF